MAKNRRDILLDFTFDEIHKYGYYQANTSNILKRCKIPKGSMYHYFNSKHALALCVIKERIAPKSLKNYHIKENGNYIDSMILFFEGINFSSKAFYYGCAMHKLIVEMSTLDKEFENELDLIFSQILAHFVMILDKSIEQGEIKKCHTKKRANYILTTLLGAISLKNREALEGLIDELKASKVQKSKPTVVKQQTLF